MDDSQGQGYHRLVDRESTGAASTGATPATAAVTRRDILRESLKVAFVAPLVTTFFARDAVAAGSNHSCYPAAHTCGNVGQTESCCAGLTCISGTCQ